MMSDAPSLLLQHLPEIYQTPEDLPNNLQKLLLAFDEVLFGPKDGGLEGLEQMIANIPNLFDPDPARILPNWLLRRTPKDFLPWLSDWVALGQLQRVPEQQCRDLIAKIVPLYACRGTKRYLSEIIRTFLPELQEVSIDDEELPSMTVGRSIIGKDSRLGGDIPFCFHVTLQFPAETVKPQKQARMKAKARSVIDLAKPAHTAYQLDCNY